MPLGPALLICTVVGIADGDTLTARCDTGTAARTLQVRLAEVDAPEKGQAGVSSRQHLAALCYQQRARVRPITARGGVDRYGRTVAHVECNGTDANTAQVHAGMAWVFDRYVTDLTLHRVQAEARAAQRGLWVDADPAPPWQWRKAHQGRSGI